MRILNSSLTRAADDPGEANGMCCFRDPVTQRTIQYRWTLLSSVGAATTHIEWAISGQAQRISRYVSKAVPTPAELQAFILAEARSSLTAIEARGDSLRRTAVRVCGPDPLANRQFARWLVASAPRYFRFPSKRNQGPEPGVPVLASGGAPAPCSDGGRNEIREFLAPTRDPHKLATEWRVLRRQIHARLELRCLRSLLKHRERVGHET